MIGSNVGGIKFSVEDGKTGFLVPPHDPAALAKKIETLINDEKLLASMKFNALKRVNKFFTWRGVAASCDQLYDKIIRAKRSEIKSGKVISIQAFQT